jgi:polyhydroxyalkanoate synthesis regulator phasin
MATAWKDVIDSLPGQVSDQAKKDAKDFIDQLLNDSNDFTQRQGKKITAYLAEYANGELSADELKGCLNDVVTLTKSHAAMESATAKQKLQKIALNVSEIIIKGLLVTLL